MKKKNETKNNQKVSTEIAFLFPFHKRTRKNKIIKHESDKFKHDLWLKIYSEKQAALISFHSQP